MKKKNMKIRLYIMLFLFCVMLLIALFGDALVPFDPYQQDLLHSLSKPDTLHWLGTDRYGRDVFSRIIAGGKITIFSSLLLVMITALTGTMIGMLGGYWGGKVDTVCMRIGDFFLAFPAMVFAIAVAGILSSGLSGAVFALACVSWPKYARLTRTATMSIKQETYFLALRLSGCSHMQILFKHIIPEVAAIILITATQDIAAMIMELAGLSFLGLGAQAPAAEWGAMMADGTNMLQLYPWVILAPGMAILVTVMVFHLLGDTLRDYFELKR